jgi:hypothetical protein
MTMTLADNLDVDARLQWCVFAFGSWVARYALAMVVFHDGRRGCLYRFLADFPIFKRPTLFSLINEHSKSFASFQKKNQSGIFYFHFASAMQPIGHLKVSSHELLASRTSSSITRVMMKTDGRVLSWKTMRLSTVERDMHLNLSNIVIFFH